MSADESGDGVGGPDCCVGNGGGVARVYIRTKTRLLCVVTMQFRNVSETTDPLLRRAGLQKPPSVQFRCNFAARRAEADGPTAAPETPSFISNGSGKATRSDDSVQ